MNQELDSICPNVSSQLHRLGEFPDSVQRDVVTILLRQACESQNEGRIMLARRAVATIPPSCISRVIETAIHSGVDLSDDWEYLRLLEILREIKSDRLAHFVALGLKSEDLEIRQAAEDFKAHPR